MSTPQIDASWVRSESADELNHWLRDDDGPIASGIADHEYQAKKRALDAHKALRDTHG